MLHINIVCVGKIKENFFKDTINEYSKRLGKYCVLNILELPDQKIPEKLNDTLIEQIKNSESENIISHLNNSAYKICLDLTGKELSSIDFAKRIDEIQQISSSITFIIGGSLGMNDKLKKLCDEKICFSRMTFPHQMIRVFLLEQIYRAFKINNNEKYHH